MLKVDKVKKTNLTSYFLEPDSFLTILTPSIQVLTSIDKISNGEVCFNYLAEISMKECTHKT